jgi:uncharacterized membrane protein
MPSRPLHRRLTGILRSRIRLWTAALVYVAIALALPEHIRLATRLLIAWNLAATLYLGLTFMMMANSDTEGLRKRAEMYQEGRWIVLSLVAAAAIAALLATVQIVHGLKTVAPGSVPLHLALCGATIVTSWLFMNVNLALIYAHEYFGPGHHLRSEPALDFPSEPDPDYWDFIYFSLVIGMTFQVSDVEIRSRLLRRLAVLHGAVSFFFNTVIVALSVNIAASVL